MTFLALLFLSEKGFTQTKETRLNITFENTANHKRIVLPDSVYVNSFAETYAITKLKYYISNINLVPITKKLPYKNIFLIDAAAEEEIALKILPGKYSAINFMLGIDSSYNNSGAQEGALDPLNGMFWTWNTGYIYFKLEGTSTASTADLNRIQHHIGGYEGVNKTDRQIQLDFTAPLVILEGDQKEMVINVNVDKYWKGQNHISISSNAIIMTTGELAKKSADNFPGMFSIKNVK
jgi:hypothetical protein